MMRAYAELRATAAPLKSSSADQTDILGQLESGADRMSLVFDKSKYSTTIGRLPFFI
jgi:hypothetical protein